MSPVVKQEVEEIIRKVLTRMLDLRGGLTHYLCAFVQFFGQAGGTVTGVVGHDEYELASIMQLTLLLGAISTDASQCELRGLDSLDPRASDAILGFLNEMLCEIEFEALPPRKIHVRPNETNVFRSERLLSVVLVGTRTSSQLETIRRELAVAYDGPLVFKALADDEVRLSDFPAYAKSDIAIFNWNKYAFLFRLFLNAHPVFTIRMVLFSGIEPSDDHSYDRIKDYGLFNYVILTNPARDDHGDRWIDVVGATIKDVREELGPVFAAEYLRYRWGDLEFPDESHFQIKVRSLGGSTWGGMSRREFPESVVQHVFTNFFTSEVRWKGKTMDVNPIWGRPAYTRGSMFCFVLMPFRQPFDAIYTDHIVPALTKLKLDVRRADDYYTVNSIMGDIWQAINDADFLIAELTGRNPNVLYEMGIAHTVGKEVVMISQDEDDIPADLRHLRYYLYEYTPRGCSRLMDSLSKVANELMKR